MTTNTSIKPRTVRHYNGYDLAKAALTGLYTGLLLCILTQTDTTPTRYIITGSILMLLLWGTSIKLLTYIKNSIKSLPENTRNEQNLS